ncbi:MAG TPA: helix-turn-helix transcriptional regulator [Acidimicrobiales bacterium]|nr:helix-turn-helix transcriptional regulator [Acidimicrobiales bacterium]
MTTASSVIQNLRKTNGFTLRSLAKRAGTSSATLSNYELGIKEPRLSTLERLVEAGGSKLLVEIIPATINGRWSDARVSAAKCSLQVADALQKNKEEIAFRVCLELTDDLKSVTPYRLAQLTMDAPSLSGDSRYDALIAAIVEDVCVNAGAPTPPWVYEDTRTTERWYVTDIESLHEDADRETPPIYRRHGVYILADELSRA